MFLPIAILGGLGLFAFYGGRGNLYYSAVKACKAQDQHKLYEAATGFEKRGDYQTGQILRDLQSRMMKAQSGAKLPPVPTFDPDNTGNPALQELGGVLWNLENRINVLKGWSAAYLRCELPVMAGQLSVKCAQLSTLYPKK